jgi:hypothetical protein
MRASAEPATARVGGVSRVRMSASASAETRKLTASIRIAIGAPINWTSAPAIPGTRDLRPRLADLELGVAVHQLVARDERGQVRRVRDVEEDGEHARGEPDQVQLEHRQAAERERDRDREQRNSSSDVGHHEDRPAAHPVDPHAGRQADEHERQELREGQHADLER